MAKGIYIGGNNTTNNMLGTEGDFDNSLAGWEILYTSDATASLSAGGYVNNCAKISVVAEPKYTSYQMYIHYLDNPQVFIGNHVYYTTSKCKCSVAQSIYIALNTYNGDGTRYWLAYGATTPITNAWTTVSARGTAQTTNTTTNKAYVGFNFTPIGGETLYIDEVKIYDLTALYGAGNEPTLAWCDANLQELELNNNRIKKIKKIYIGANVTTPNNTNNLVTNGNFANNLTGWDTQSGGTVTVKTDAVYGTYAAVNWTSASAMTVLQSTAQMSDGTPRVMYACCNARAYSTNTGRTELYTCQGGVYIPYDDTWGFYSFRVSNSLNIANLENTKIHILQRDATAAGNKLDITDIRCYDLTALYGAGNEPTKAWCDANLANIITKSIAHKVKKAYIGVNGVAKLCYTESYDSFTAATPEVMSDLFTVTNGSYYFQYATGTAGRYEANNLGINSSTATTTLTAKRNMVVRVTTAATTESSYDKFTYKAGSTTIRNAVSGTVSALQHADLAITAGTQLVFTYAKDSSRHATGESCYFVLSAKTT